MKSTTAIDEAITRASAEGRVRNSRPTSHPLGCICVMCFPPVEPTPAKPTPTTPNSGDERQDEKQFQSDVMTFAQRQGWLCYHTRDSRKSAPGFPDLCMVRGLRVVFAELKAQKGKTTGPQDDWLTALSIVALSAPEYVGVFLWRPSDWNEIAAVLA